MNKQKTLTIAVIVLVMMNIGTLSFLWMNKASQKNHHTKHRRPNVEGYLTKKLSLSDSQAKAFRKARKNHFEQRAKLERSLHADRKHLSQLLSDTDTINQEELIRKITHKSIKLEKIYFKHLQYLRSMCTEEQKIKFDSVILKVIDKGAKSREPKRAKQSRK